MSSTPLGSDSASTMIEFACSGCGRSLKVPASAAGRKASCPSCYGVIQVPTATAADTSLQPPAASWQSAPVTSQPQFSPPPQFAPQPPQQFAPQPAQPTFTPPASGAPAFAPAHAPTPVATAPVAGIHM